MQQYTIKRREKERYKQKLFQANKNMNSLQKEHDTLVATNAALVKTNDDYKQKNNDNKQVVKQLTKEKTALQNDHDELEAQYHRKDVANHQMADEIQKLKTELEAARITGDPEKTKDLKF